MKILISSLLSVVSFNAMADEFSCGKARIQQLGGVYVLCSGEAVGPNGMRDVTFKFRTDAAFLWTGTTCLNATDRAGDGSFVRFGDHWSAKFNQRNFTANVSSSWSEGGFNTIRCESID